MWKRTVSINARWDCISAEGYISKSHSVFVNITDNYINKPFEDIILWASRVSNEITQKMCERACQSLSDSVFCNTIFPDIGTPKDEGEAIIPESIIDLYIKLKNRIKSENKKINIWENERDEILSKKLTPELIKKRQDLINKINRSFKIIREDEIRISQIELQYPGIDKIINK